jgi:hypothetical protein
MKTHANVLMKNEATLLQEVLKFWKDYPVDKFLFWNDHSTDNSVEVVKDILGDRADIWCLENTFNEANARNVLASLSKQEDADLIFSLDCDELFSRSLVDHFDTFCKSAVQYNIGIKQCNVVNGSLNWMRMDPKYKHNYRFFAIPVKNMQLLPVTKDGIHQSEREPFVNLTKVGTDDFAFIHLQAINTKFYAMKQVYYKIDQIRKKVGNYEKIIRDIEETANGLRFEEVSTPFLYIDNWKFDPKVFDKVLEERGYETIIRDYIKETGDREFCKLALEFLNEERN